MKKINVSKNTVVKSTPETFELIKALFKANGVDTDYIGFGYARANDYYVVSCCGGVFHGDKLDDDTEITLEQLAFESLAAPDWATMIILGDDGKYKWIDHNVPTERVRVKFVGSDDDEEGYTPRINTVYTQKVVLQKQPEQPKPQSTNYRKISDLEPWEIVKRWQEEDDLYAHQSTAIGGFAKIRHIQQLAQLISQDKVYEQASEFDMFLTRVAETPAIQSLPYGVIEKMFVSGLRFTTPEQ